MISGTDYDFYEEKKCFYRNLSMDEIIHRLAVFVSNLLLNESNLLHNWTLHISGTIKKTEKLDIEKNFSPKHILELYEAFLGKTIFGRSDVMEVKQAGVTAQGKFI